MASRRPWLLLVLALCLALGAGSSPAAAAPAAGPRGATVSIDVLLGVGAPAAATHGRVPFFAAARIGGGARPWMLQAETTQQIRPFERTYGVSFALKGLVTRTDDDATIDTGRRMAPWGHVRLRMRFERMVTTRGTCETRTATTGPLLPLRRGEPGFDLRTHTVRFHEIARSRMQGTLLHIVDRLDPSCPGPEQRPGCHPFAGIATANPGRRFDFEAVRFHDGGVGMSAGYLGPRVRSGTPFETASVGQYPGVRRFPSSHFWTARDGSALVLHGANGGPFPGRLRFTPDSPPHNDGTRTCRKYFEEGRPTGTLRTAFEVYGNRKVGGEMFAQITLRVAGSATPEIEPSALPLFSTGLRRSTTAAALAELIRSGRAPLDALGLLAAR